MIRRLTAAELAARPDYVHFLRGLAIGEGGMADTATEGVGKQALKLRLTAAAQAAGVNVRYHRSGANAVVFEVVA